jgi:hypothetical protein
MRAIPKVQFHRRVALMMWELIYIYNCIVLKVGLIYIYVGAVHKVETNLYKCATSKVGTHFDNRAVPTVRAHLHRSAIPEVRAHL